MRELFGLLLQDLGTPSDKIWPGPPSYSELPAVKKVNKLFDPFLNAKVLTF